MHEEEGKKRGRSSHGDNTNVLTKEFEALTVKSEGTIFDKLPNEVMSNLYVFGSRMLNQVLRDINGTGIVTIDNEMFLTNTIIMEKFLHP